MMAGIRAVYVATVVVHVALTLGNGASLSVSQESLLASKIAKDGRQKMPFLNMFGQGLDSSHQQTFNEEDVGEPLLLTPYLATDQKIAEARNLSKVTHSGLNKIATSYTGFLTVNSNSSSNIFFWYIKAKVRHH